MPSIAAPPARTGRPYRPRGRLDLAGALVSTACAVHCALAPVALATVSAAALPGAVLGLFDSAACEWGLVASAALIAAWSLLRTRRARPLGARAPLLLGGGFTALVVGRLLEARLATAFTLPVIVLGGVAVAAAHLELRRANRCPCRTRPTGDPHRTHA